MTHRFEKTYAIVRTHPELTDLIPFLPPDTGPERRWYMGNNLLHRMVDNRAKPALFHTLIRVLGDDVVSDMACMINTQNLLPGDMLPFDDITDEVREIRALLQPLAQWRLPIKKPYEFIQTDDVLQEYAVSPDSQLGRNLDLACMVFNQTRARNIRSSTHPMADITGDERLRLQDRTEALRKRCDDGSLSGGLSLLVASNPYHLFGDPKRALVKRVAVAAEEEGVGNCHEQACIAYTIARDSDAGVAAQMYIIHPGDHMFLVLGSGAERVVCDPWVGEVFPLSHAAYRLCDFAVRRNRDGSETNRLLHFNPDAQQLVPAVFSHDALFKLHMFLIFFIPLGIRLALYCLDVSGLLTPRDEGLSRAP